ncbi:Uncharacterised protein [Mycobacteroides abscessus subsp. abscessus]|nr:Uncharacterised protein [Mycobacteroides abscessus subsp. abscessus]SIA88442.1 Uncharacterised protein [Mycobacteroides abscessus subsp. abscessus]SIC65298.1 Uncharacterised protein [Mycobacteroides abscessus subsp. abscessus]
MAAAADAAETAMAASAGASSVVRMTARPPASSLFSLKNRPTAIPAVTTPVTVSSSVENAPLTRSMTPDWSISLKKSLT